MKKIALGWWAAGASAAAAAFGQIACAARGVRLHPEPIDHQWRPAQTDGRHAFPGGLVPPTYNDGHGSGDPFCQIDTHAAIPAVEGGVTNYRVDGY